MLIALMAKNKLGFVDGSIPRAAPNDLLFDAWTRYYSIVISWLLNVVAREIADSLLYFDTASEIWIDLHYRCHQSNGPRIFQLKKHLIALNQGFMDVNSYYTRLKIIWDELKVFQPVPICHYGGMKPWLDYQHQEYVMQFLMGLNDSYAQIHT